MTSRPRFFAISTVSSLDTSSTRMIRSTRSWGMSAYVRSSVRAALYAGMTTTTSAVSGSVFCSAGAAGNVAGDFTRGSVPHPSITPPSSTRRIVTRSPVTTHPETSMFERLFGTAEKDPAVMERIPPGQYKTEKFPVLHYGSVPRTDLSTWDFRVYGEV